MRVWDRLARDFAAVDTEVEIFCLMSRFKKIPNIPNKSEARDILFRIEVEDCVDVSLRDDQGVPWRNRKGIVNGEGQLVPRERLPRDMTKRTRRPSHLVVVRFSVSSLGGSQQKSASPSASDCATVRCAA
jgi:hypothetical protein